jgi:hypothetical protein
MAKRKTTEERNKELAKDGFKLRHYGLKLRMEPNESRKLFIKLLEMLVLRLISTFLKKWKSIN